MTLDILNPYMMLLYTLIPLCKMVGSNNIFSVCTNNNTHHMFLQTLAKKFKNLRWYTRLFKTMHDRSNRSTIINVDINEAYPHYIVLLHRHFSI